MDDGSDTDHDTTDDLAAVPAGRRALIVLGGEVLLPADLPGVPDHDVVIAADSGVDQAHRLGLTVDVAVGDFDSVSPTGLDRAARQGAQVHRHPVAKDATDFELALECAVELGATSASIVGGEGGRLDHLIANALVLASARYEQLVLSAYGRGAARLHVIRRRRRFAGIDGELVTLLAVNGPAVGVSTTNLLYPLRDEDLAPGSSRGVSNQLTADHAEVTLRGGVLLAILPGPEHRLP